LSRGLPTQPDAINRAKAIEGLRESLGNEALNVHEAVLVVVPPLPPPPPPTISSSTLPYQGILAGSCGSRQVGMVWSISRLLWIDGTLGVTVLFR